MSPKKGMGGHSGNGGGRELQALLDSAVAQIEDKDDAAGQIPWRTSRRLQEATFRSLTKERDIDNTVTIKKEKESPESLSSRAIKRQRSPSSPTTPLELCQAEELDDGEGSGESCCLNDDNSKKGIIVNGPGNSGMGSSSKRKRRTVHFADPLFFYIEDTKKEEAGVRKPAAEKKSAHQNRNENARSPKLGVGTQHQPKLPMSCFDLLCNYSGTKGWRCYRIRFEGESYCSYHLSSKPTPAPSIVRISLCT